MTDLVITDHNFKANVLENSLPVVLDFWAPWCPPCKMIEPVIDELAKEYSGKVAVGKVNTDENPQVAADLNVMSMPTVMFFKDGKPFKALIGAQGKHAYKQAIDELLIS